jgi:hypothetical protein
MPRSTPPYEVTWGNVILQGGVLAIRSGDVGFPSCCTVGRCQLRTVTALAIYQTRRRTLTTLPRMVAFLPGIGG